MREMVKLNASPKVFWAGLAISVAMALLVWVVTDTGWGAVLVVVFLRVMLLPSRYHHRTAVSEAREQAARAGVDQRS